MLTNLHGGGVRTFVACHILPGTDVELPGNLPLGDAVRKKERLGSSASVCVRVQLFLSVAVRSFCELFSVYKLFSVYTEERAAV